MNIGNELLNPLGNSVAVLENRPLEGAVFIAGEDYVFHHLVMRVGNGKFTKVKVEAADVIFVNDIFRALFACVAGDVRPVAATGTGVFG